MKGLVAAALLLATGSIFGADRPVEFNRDVRPILSDKCFLCHGPDAAAKKIPLRLDSEAAAKADLGGRRAIVEGDPAASNLVKRITAEKPGTRMPPVQSGLKLADSEIETLKSWVEQGAKWQKHWSLIAPAHVAPPQVGNAQWARNGIDHFVLNQLERVNLQPSPEADRETLIRRVSLDLTGLPPPPGDIDAFLKDKSAKAYERVVDRLLASPSYGERMAVRWLDAARYADSNGYQYDGERVMWRWRDWVIDSFNRNQPFDQFTIEQIAGDLLPNATLDQKIATGFNRNHRANTEDGIIPEEYAVEYVVDRLETTSTVFLGLTLGCARCHNHKYDPFSQKEFYQFFAYFNNVPELGRAMKYGNSPPVLAAPTSDQQKQLALLNQRIDREKSVLESQRAVVEREQQSWERSLAGQPDEYWFPGRGLTASFTFDAPSGAVEEKSGALTYRGGRIANAAVFDGSTFVQAGNAGNFEIDDRFTLSAWIYADANPDGSVMSRMVEGPKGKGYGVHLDSGKVHVNLTSNYADDAIRLETEQTLEPKRWHHITVTYTGSRMAEGVKVYVNGAAAPVKVLLDTLYRPFRNAGKPFREPFRIGAGWGAARRFRGSIDDVRIYDRVLDPEETAALAVGEPLNQIAKKPRSERSTAAQRQLDSFFRQNVAKAPVREAWKNLAALELERESLERTFPTVMVMAESEKPKDTFLLVRGAYDKPGERVQPGVPEVLHPLRPDGRNNRLALAKWLVDPANPLTARVTVNRFWQLYFGAGLVKTIEDFGVQGDLPSHPQLLDWLATEFIRTGWDVKAMQKLIVMSAAYRQSSKAPAELVARDPENRLLARGPRQRLAPEMVRDQALFAAGLLTNKIGGPSVKPYQPDGLWKELSMQDMDYVQSKGADLYRRGLYTFWKRTIPPPMMVNFDAANREACVVRETRTNTPLQALNLMNDITFVEAARFIAQRMLKQGGDDDTSRLAYGFRLLTARIPGPAEMQVMRKNLNFHRDYFNSQPERAHSLLKQGDSPRDPALKPSELAAYASVASLMLNLDEVVTKE
jgi:hypothetical protein